MILTIFLGPPLMFISEYLKRRERLFLLNYHKLSNRINLLYYSSLRKMLIKCDFTENLW